MPLDELHLDPANAREHGERNLETIRASLTRFGQAEPLVVHASTGRVIGGNGRLVAMRELGWTEADIVEIEADGVTATALGIALNRTAELATWDESALGRILESLQAEGELDGVGFSGADLNALIESLDESVVEDVPPEPPAEATTKPGDLWILGKHRLLCGDSSDADDVDRLLDGADVHLVNMDPPYGVAVSPRSNNAVAAGLSSFEAEGKATGPMRAKDRPIANDAVSDEDYAVMLRQWFGNAARVLLPGRAFYIWGGYANCANYPSALVESELYFSQSIIWDKQHPVISRKDFMGAHEWCFYGWKSGKAHQWLGPMNVSDLWQVKKLHHSETVHLTEKPVELAARAMKYSSRTGENVLDLFGGSGSTMAAAEQLGRHAFLMELDPLYCDVIVERWKQLTNEEPVLNPGG